MQWLGDLALQACGSISALFDLAMRNGMSITDELTVGAELATPSVVDKRVHSWYSNNSIEPATADNQQQGIGYWTIGVNFRVS